MNTRFLGALAFAAALTLPTVACAQQGPAQPNSEAPASAGHHRAGPAAALEGLNLTPDQTAKLEPVLVARQQKIAGRRLPDPHRTVLTCGGSETAVGAGRGRVDPASVRR